MTEELSRVGEEHASNRSRVCKCGRVAVEKVVGPRSANRGLRYLCCDRFVLFGKKINSCRFFEWIDQPRVSKEQRKEAQAVLHKENGAALGNGALLQPAIRTRNAVTDLEKKCETIEGLHVNKETFELEIRVSKDDPPQTQVHKNGRNAGMGIPITSQQGLIAHDGAHIVMEIESDAAQMTYDDRVFLGKHPQSSPTNSFQPKTGDTLKEADTAVSEALKDKDTNQESKQSLENAFELLETPTCLCWRAAVLKTVKSKGPNKGLRFWVCSNSQPFYMKNKKSELNAGEESCKFFSWIDQPRISKEQKREAQALLQKEEGDASGKRALLQPEVKTQNALRDLKKQCKATEGLIVNKETFDLEMRDSGDDTPQTQGHKDGRNAVMDVPIASQYTLVTCDRADDVGENESDVVQMTYNGGFLLAEQLQSSPTHSVGPETRTCELNATLQQKNDVVKNVHGLNLSVGDTLKGARSIGEVPKEKDANQEGMQSLENASEFLETPTCLCSRAAVLKTVKSKGPNKGLRYWVCSNSQPFYMKKKSKLNAGEESCKFFRWIDEPRVSKEQKKKAQALLQKEKGAASGKRALPQPELRTQSAVRDLEKRCKTTEGLHVNKENFELEMRFSHNDLPHTQVGKDVGNAIMDIPSASFVTRDGADVTMENGSNAAQMTYNGGFFLAEHLQSSTTLSVQPDSRTYKLNATLQQNQAVIEDHGLNLSAGDTLKGADTSISEVAKDKNTNQEGMQSLENASESLETPTCLCSRAAVLKTVKSKGPNTGLRFWVCANSQPFYVKKKSKLNAGEESCKFFRWVDTPFEKSDTQKNQEKQRRKDTQKRKELSSLS